MNVERIVGDLIDSNVFVVGDENFCFVVDAGAKVEKVQAVVGKRNVLAILLTHGHYDHCFFVREYQKIFSCKIYAGEKAKFHLEKSDWNYSDGSFEIHDFSSFTFLSENGNLKIGNFQVEHFSCSGHSLADMVFRVGRHVFVGDLMIGRSMGRIDLIGGNKNEMLESLQFLKSLEYEIMHSGHGEDLSKGEQDDVADIWMKYLAR